MGGGGSGCDTELYTSDMMSCVLTSSENQEYKTKKINFCYQ